MKEYIEERAVAIANYIIDYNATVRQAARKFGISKSTVHKDVAFRLDGRSAIFSASLQTISKYAIVASIHKAICQPDSGIWKRRRNGKILN